MTTTTNNLRRVAEMGERAFRKDTRDDGSTYWHTVGDRPAWLDDVVYRAHGEMMPDDFIYEHIHAAFQWLAEALDYSLTVPGGEDLPEATDFAEAYVDVYNNRLAAWLASHVLRGSYVDEAREEYGFDDGNESIWTLIARGQYLELVQIAGAVIEGVTLRAEEEV